MCTNCASLIADLFLFRYERDFMVSLFYNTEEEIVQAFNYILISGRPFKYWQSLLWFKLYFLCIPTHEQLHIFTDIYDIQNGIQKKVS